MDTSAAAAAKVLPGVEHPLRNPRYRRWLLGAVLSLLGDQCYVVALPWVILQLGSATLLGAVVMAGAVPRAVLMLIGGAMTDRLSARRIMLWAALARAVSVAVLGTLAWLGALAVWEVFALVIVFGIADAFAIPAQSAFVPSLLSREQLVASTSLQQGAALLTGIAGPVVVGAAIVPLGVGAALWADALSFIAVIGALLTLPDPPLAAPSKGTLKDIAGGFAYVRRDTALLTVILVVAAVNLCTGGAFYIGIAFLAKARLGSSLAYGVLLSAVAAGQLAGALAAGFWKTPRRGVLILGAAALLSVCLMSLARVDELWSAAAVLAVSGAAAGLLNVQLAAWVMQRIEPEVRGRVVSVVMLSSLGIAPVSMALAGFVTRWGVSVLFLVFGAALLMVTVAAASVGTVRGIRE